jgi:hypothetical protein
MLRIIKMANKLIKRRTNINRLHPITSKRRHKENHHLLRVCDELDYSADCSRY